jgi:hypothetical protein
MTHPYGCWGGISPTRPETKKHINIALCRHVEGQLYALHTTPFSHVAPSSSCSSWSCSRANPTCIHTATCIPASSILWVPAISISWSSSCSRHCQSVSHRWSRHEHTTLLTAVRCSTPVVGLWPEYGRWAPDPWWFSTCWRVSKP